MKEQEALLPTRSTLARLFQGVTKPGDLLFKHEDFFLVRLTLAFEFVLEAMVASLEPNNSNSPPAAMVEVGNEEEKE